jgi:hypothetical protein
VRRILAILAVTVALPAPAALAQTSPGISVVGSIPERGVVSARPVGNLLYVSSLSGITVFDVANPRAPVRVGRLELPHVQNEDVDVGSGILLVSDDPYGGRGVLHVVDVEDPANPRVISTLNTWARGLTNPFGAPPRERGIGHTVTCIDDCKWAWLAGSTAGIDIVDLRDPAKPRIARRFAAKEAAGVYGTHDVQVDAQGLAWVTGAAGTAAYDTSRPLRPKLVFRTNRAGGFGPYNDFIHHNSLRLRDDVVAITEEDFGRSGCRRAGTLQTWLIRGNRKLRPLDTFGVERDAAAQVACSAHYFDARDGLIAQGFYEQGLRLIDARRPGKLRQVGFHIDRPGMVWGALFAPTDPTGSTIYSLDHARGIDVIAIDRAALAPVDRRGAKRPPGRAKGGYGLAISDGYEAVRAGQRLSYQLLTYGRGGPVDVSVTLPPELTNVKPPRGARYDPATRVLTYRHARLRGQARKTLRARVAGGLARGTPIELIGYAVGADDPFPVDDRGVDHAVVGSRAERERSIFAATASAGAAAAAGVTAAAPGAQLGNPAGGFCRLPRY